MSRTAPDPVQARLLVPLGKNLAALERLTETISRLAHGGVGDIFISNEVIGESKIRRKVRGIDALECGARLPGGCGVGGTEKSLGAYRFCSCLSAYSQPLR